MKSWALQATTLSVGSKCACGIPPRGASPGVVSAGGRADVLAPRPALRIPFACRAGRRGRGWPRAPACGILPTDGRVRRAGGGPGGASARSLYISWRCQERKDGEMRKVVVINHVTLDGVMQAPGYPDEDTRGGFAHGAGRHHAATARRSTRSASGWATTGRFCSAGGPTKI